MDSLLDSASTYIDVLQNSSSDNVTSWKHEDLERAINWAQYFRRVYGRIQKKPALVIKFDAQLKEIGAKKGVRFGLQELSSEFLGDSLSHLVRTLLENPSLPDDIKQLIYQKYATSDDSMYIDKSVQSQALLNTLSIIHSRLTANLAPQASLLMRGDPLLVADAVLLQEEVEWILSQHSCNNVSKQQQLHMVYSKLYELVKQKNGMEVILYSIIGSKDCCHSSNLPTGTVFNSQQSTKAVIEAPGIILQWLEHALYLPPLPEPMDQDEPHQNTKETSIITSNDPIHYQVTHTSAHKDTSTSDKFWELSPHLLAGITVKSVEFFRLYYKLLSTKANHLQATIIDEFGKNEDGKKKNYFDKFERDILQYFKALLTVDNDKVHEVTVALVKSQVEETAAKILAIKQPDTASNCSTPLVRYPVNIWRRVLAMAEEITSNSRRDY